MQQEKSLGMEMGKEYIIRRTHVDMPEVSLNINKIRNEKKHKESCLKARKKRKRKKK